MRQKKKNPKLILFDLDGTLAESLQIGLKTINQLRFLFGYKKLGENDERLRRVSGMRFAQEILGLNIFQMLIWIKLVKMLVIKQADKIGIYRGWKTRLKLLKKNYRLAVLTSSPETYAKTILRNAKINHHFEFIQSDISYHRKAKALKKILKNHNLKCKDVMYLGDELRDFNACQACNIPFVAVTWGKDHKDLFLPHQEKIIGIINSPKELSQFLRK